MTNINKENTLETGNTKEAQALYKDYARDFKNPSGQFDQAWAERWVPCFEYYMRNWLPTSKSVNILDLGCGEGRLLYIFGKKGHTSIEGVDISESQLAIARQVSGQIHQQDVITFLETTNKRFDLIVSFDLIEHLEKPRVLAFLDLCHEKLSPGGRLVLQTPNASSPFFGDVRYGDFTHQMAFTPVLLLQLLKRCGFSHCEAREAGPVPGYSFTSTIRFVLWQIIRCAISLVEKVETGGSSDMYTRVFLASGVKSND